MEVTSYEINGRSYILMNKIIIDDVTYLFLMNEHNPDDIFLRKIFKDNEDELHPLDNEDEVNKVLEFYGK